MADSNEPTRMQESADMGDLPTTGVHTSVDPSDPLCGKVLKGAYRISGKIAEGGMGVVYRASQIALGRPVAVKMVHVHAVHSPTAEERFFREARILSQLQHPNIVQIIDFGSEPGPLHFMVMEFLHGETLEAFVQNRKQPSLELVLDLFEQVCAGMSAAHQNQVIHRDLKPSNVFVVNVTGSPRPVVKILDFGLSKALDTEPRPADSGLTREGVMMGTCGYSAPEQIHGETVDVRADIYSLGAILYYLVSGRPPYRDEGFQGTLRRQLTEDPDPLEAPWLPEVQRRELEAVIRRAMSAQPSRRHATPTELLADLARIVRPGETVSDRLTPSQIGLAVRRPGESRGSQRTLLLVGVLAVVAVSALAAFTFWPRHQAPSRPGATAPGVTGTEILLGLSAPFSGSTREVGRGIQTGIETYFRHVNDEGGILGRELQLIALDDGYEPARTRENMQRLLKEKHVFGFIGNVGTPTSEVALPIALENRRIFFAPHTGARFLRRDPPDRYVFNYRASYSEETSAIVHYLMYQRKVPADGIAVLAQEDSFGEDGFQGVIRALRRLGRPTDAVLRVGYQRNTAEVTAAVDAVLAARGRIKAVVMVAAYRPAAVFIRKVRDAGLDVIFTNVSFTNSDALAESLREMGPKYADGVIVTQVVPHYQSNATGVLQYREHLRTYFPSESPGFISLEGYIAARVLVEGLKNAGADLTPETLVAGLEKIRDLDLAIGTPITFGPSDHQGSHKVWATVLDRKGIYQNLDLD